MISHLCHAAALFGMKCEEEHVATPEIREKFMSHMEDYGLSFGTVEEFQFRLQLFA